MLSESIYREAYVQFLAKVRQARLDAQLTQGEVARLLGEAPVLRFEGGVWRAPTGLCGATGPRSFV